MYFQVASQAFSFIVSFIYLLFLAQKLNMHDLSSPLALSSFKLKKRGGGNFRTTSRSWFPAYFWVVISLCEQSPSRRLEGSGTPHSQIIGSELDTWPINVSLTHRGSLGHLVALSHHLSVVVPVTVQLKWTNTPKDMGHLCPALI